MYIGVRRWHHSPNMVSVAVQWPLGVPNDAAGSGAGHAAPDHSECSGSDWRKHVLGEGGAMIIFIMHDVTHIYSQLRLQNPCA